MRVLGLDLGSVTCGVAVSDPLKIVARSVETIRFPAEENDIAVDRIKQLCKELDVDTIVLGLPKQVVMVDERLTTVAANKVLLSADVSRKKRKKVIDQMAAVQILQGYLDRGC